MAALGLIGLSLRYYFKFILEEVKRARKFEEDVDEADDEGLTPERLAARAATDDIFKSRLSDLLDTVRSMPEVTSLGLGAGKSTATQVIPSGYFLDVQRRLLVPADLVSRVVKLPDHRIFLDKPVGDPASRWRVIWWEGAERVDAVAEIVAGRLKRFLGEKYDPEFRQMVADVEFTEVINRRTMDRIVSNARITRVKRLPYRTPSESKEWLKSTSVAPVFKDIWSGLLGPPRKNDDGEK